MLRVFNGYLFPFSYYGLLCTLPALGRHLNRRLRAPEPCQRGWKSSNKVIVCVGVALKRRLYIRSRAGPIKRLSRSPPYMLPTIILSPLSTVIITVIILSCCLFYSALHNCSQVFFYLFPVFLLSLYFCVNYRFIFFYLMRQKKKKKWIWSCDILSYIF